MKLSSDSISRLDTLIQNAMIGGITKLVIADGKIRGVDAKQTVVIVTKDNVPDFDGKSIGINRIEQLSARINLVKTQGPLNIEATVSTSGQDISILDLNSGKTKAQFRCASVEAVKGVPKNIADVLVWEVKVAAKFLPTLIQGISAMSSETVTIASRDGKVVSFECVDTNKDVFTTDMVDEATWIGADAPGSSFCWKYSAKTLIALLREATKNSDGVMIQLGQGGILLIKVNGIDFFVIPPQ